MFGLHPAGRDRPARRLPRDLALGLRGHIDEAKRLLESTAVAAEEVGAEVGYSDASFFRRLFKRLVGVSPGQ